DKLFAFLSETAATSTLVIPYTTLFRSGLDRRRGGRQRPPPPGAAPGRSSPFPWSAGDGRGGHQPASHDRLRCRGRGAADQGNGLDRKSTRLNHSHVKI